MQLILLVMYTIHQLTHSRRHKRLNLYLWLSSLADASLKADYLRRSTAVSHSRSVSLHNASSFANLTDEIFMMFIHSKLLPGAQPIPLDHFTPQPDI